MRVFIIEFKNRAGIVTRCAVKAETKEDAIAEYTKVKDKNETFLRVSEEMSTYEYSISKMK